MKLSDSVKFLTALLLLIIISSFVFHSPIYPYDLITGLQTSEFSIAWPTIRIFIEPFYSFTFYALTLNKDFYKPAIISWILWTLCVVLVYCFLSKKTVYKTIYNVIYLSVFFTALFSFVALAPVPGPTLLKPRDYIAIDAHSHTISSHDNVAPAIISLKAHLRQGFDAFFNTEHNHTMGFANFPEYAKFKIVYPGMQIQTNDGISIILLSSKEFDGLEYKNLDLADIANKAHKNNMFVLMPHWWKWHKHTFEELKNFGMDGFEIYNCGYRNFDKNEQSSLINFAKENNLMMFGVTDWHGWGYMSDVWTVMEGVSSENIEGLLTRKPNTKVILYRKEQSGSVIRFIFEPFFFFYYYISDVDLKHLASFIIWLAASFLAFRSRFWKYLKRFFALIMTVAYAAGLVYFYIVTRSVAETNATVMNSVAPVMAGLCVLWFILWRFGGDNKII
ncbi:MAG: hypothetical protein LBT58_00910 [Endomicrobium sp.]|jgi:hypothetical protein|nr:hypothetical protein [Endomicrobium sp.]